MTDSKTEASTTYDDDLAPWWAWGYVLAVPFALLASATPWFRAVIPPDIADDSNQHIDYTAWTHFPIGILCPLILIVPGIQWYRARRHWKLPPGNRKIRRARAVTTYKTSDGRVHFGAADDSPTPLPPPADTNARGAWFSISMVITCLILFGLNRALFRPYYTDSSLDFSGSTYSEGRATVHIAVGCWFLLIAAGLFFATSAFGLLRSDQPSPTWEVYQSVE